MANTQEIGDHAKTAAMSSEDQSDLLRYDQVRATCAVADALNRIADALIGYDEAGLGVNIKNRCIQVDTGS